MINFRGSISSKAEHGQISVSLVDFLKPLGSRNLVYLLAAKGPNWIYFPLTKMQVLSPHPPRLGCGPASFQWPSPGKGSCLSYSAPIATSVYLHYSPYHFDAIICLVSSTRWLVPGGRRASSIHLGNLST